MNEKTNKPRWCRHQSRETEDRDSKRHNADRR